jgi:hypothetical protein
MVKKRRTKRTSERLESQALVHAAFELARSLNISKLVVQADELRHIRLVSQLRGPEQVIWLTRGAVESGKSTWTTA